MDSLEGIERDSRAKEYFDRRMEDLGVWGDEKGRPVTNNIDGGGRRGEVGCCLQ